MTNSYFLILFLFLSLFLGIWSELDLNQKIKKIFLGFYYIFWNIFFIAKVGITDFNFYQIVFEIPLGSQKFLMANFDFKNMTLFSIIGLFFLYRSIFADKKWDFNYFRVITLVYITLFINSHILVLFVFEGFSWLYFLKSKPCSRIQIYMRHVHLILGNFLILCYFVNFIDNLPIASWIFSTMILTRSLSFIYSLKVKQINWPCLLYFFLGTTVLLGSFEEKGDSNLILFIVSFLCLLIMLFESKSEKKQGKFSDIYLTTIFSAIILFFSQAISYQILILIFSWSFLAYYFFFYFKKYEWKIIFLLFLSFIPPSPLFLVVFEFIFHNHSSNWHWIQWIFTLLNFYGAYCLGKYFLEKKDPLNDF